MVLVSRFLYGVRIVRPRVTLQGGYIIVWIPQTARRTEAPIDFLCRSPEPRGSVGESGREHKTVNGRKTRGGPGRAYRPWLPEQEALFPTKIVCAKNTLC